MGFLVVGLFAFVFVILIFRLPEPVRHGEADYPLPESYPMALRMIARSFGQ